MILADKITQLRKKNSLTQEELAEKIHVSRQSVSKWEGAQSIPDLEKIIQMSNLFGVSTDYLLKDELGEDQYTQNTDNKEYNKVRIVTMQEANEFLNIKGITSKRTAIGVFLCIISPICLFLMSILCESEKRILPMSEEMGCGIGIIVLIVLVAIAVAMFVSCKYKASAFGFLDNEVFETEYGVSGMVKERRSQYNENNTRNNIMATTICILSVIPLLTGGFTNNDIMLIISLCITIATAGVGASIFVVNGIRWQSMQKLLQDGDYAPANKDKNKLIKSVSPVYWPLVTALYLGISFANNNWTISWIVWPVASLLFVAVTAVCNVIDQKRNK